LPLIEGYGLAEVAGPAAGDSLEEYLPGSVGRPLDGVEVRIAESGEILVRGPTLMLGYWNNPGLTADALTDDGWLQTGDLGEIRDGRLYVHGRLRDVIVLSTGEKLAPADIESQLLMDPLFEQAIAIGDKRPIVAALVVLAGGAWERFAAERRLDPSAPNDPAAEKALLERIAYLCRTYPEYAQIRRVGVCKRPWTIDQGLLSVTMKVKRDAVCEMYREQIDGLFAGHE
jgi:long-chain acyl-CoA synthetase